MINYPNIDPILLQIGPIAIRWYGIMYLLGFVGGYLLALKRLDYFSPAWDKQKLQDFVFYAAMGVILGGRIGYVLFYTQGAFITNPLLFFKVWQGGMSFHGGMLGVIISLSIFAKQNKIPYLKITDFAIPLLPLGLGLGRIGNFINAELWGKVTTVPWAFVFPNTDYLPRHPSQLYEFFLEGVVLFIILWWYSKQRPAPGKVSALFLILYSCFRFLIEFYRLPDSHLGYIAFNWLTMGQLLSIPMFLFGLLLFFKKKSCNNI